MEQPVKNVEPSNTQLKIKFYDLKNSTARSEMLPTLTYMIERSFGLKKLKFFLID